MSESVELVNYSERRAETTLWAGLSNTIVMDVCPKVQLSGGFQWLVNPFERGLFDKPVARNQDYGFGKLPNSQMLFQFGAGFKL